MKYLFVKGLDSVVNCVSTVTTRQVRLQGTQFTAGLIRMCVKQETLLALIFGLLLISTTFADTLNTTQVGRYLVESNGPAVSQSNPLQQTFSLTFPPSIQTVGEAVTYILSNTGYNLASVQHQSAGCRVALSSQLSLSDRQMGPMTVEQALLSLVGNSYQLLIDPANKLVSFRLKPIYHYLYSEQQ